MTVIVAAGGVVRLAGACPVEDAEALLQHLLGTPEALVNWAECESAHTAVIQVLLVARSVPVGTPVSGFLRDYVGPLLRRAAQ
jgi:hypothetical protein